MDKWIKSAIFLIAQNIHSEPEVVLILRGSDENERVAGKKRLLSG